MTVFSVLMTMFSVLIAIYVVALAIIIGDALDEAMTKVLYCAFRLLIVAVNIAVNILAFAVNILNAIFG